MTAGAPFTARARTDARDWLIEADEPLAGLQLRSGGELPGIIASPALLELVRKARLYGLRLARAIRAQDDHEQVTAWVEVEPGEDGLGCTIGVSNWQTAPLPGENGEAAERRAGIARQLAGPLAEEYSNYAADIATAGEHLLALIDDLADLEVVEDEQFTTAPDRIDLADVARRAAGILGVRAQERGIGIDAPKQGETVLAVGEFRRVLQVLLNLVGNAIRYSPEGSVVWLRVEQDGDRARLVVADQGEGLSEEQQGRVFEKFERLGRQGDGGSGLGLYISRRLARAMEGELTVESAPGQGARFILELPSFDDERAEPR